MYEKRRWLPGKEDRVAMEAEEYMEKGLELKIIGHVRTDFTSKFGIPRQSGLIEELKGTIVMEPEYREPAAFKGLSDFSHIWLIWEFSENLRDGWSPTVRPPRLGGNKRVGVFATRSPFRPNALGLSCVKLEQIEMDEKLGPVLHISGADLMDGTPVFDIKPYLPFVDGHPEACGGFTDRTREYSLTVEAPEELLCRIPEEKREALKKVLSQDPRPSYQKDPGRVYGMEFAGFEVKFSVENGRIYLRDVEKTGDADCT